MSAEFGGGSTEDQPMAQATQDAGQRVIADLFYAFAAYLFDYCEGLLRDPDKAADAVRDTLILADAEIGKLRDPDRLRVWLYSIARRQCLMVSCLASGNCPVAPRMPAADDFVEPIRSPPRTPTRGNSRSPTLRPRNTRGRSSSL